MAHKNLFDHKKSERLSLRIIPQSKRLIEQAATIQHATPTDFIVRTLVERAEQIVAEQSHFYLDKEKWWKFCQALDQPPRDIPELRKLASEKTVLEKTE
jgi:uncharacterized protein (DUF1778 family)